MLKRRVASLIPHLRVVSDQNENNFALENEITKEKPNTLIETVQRFPEELSTVQLENGKYVEIREFRDEARRPWWNFFDEFEYRETTRQLEVSKSYCWFDPEASLKEKRLLLKLDILIAFYSFVGYWIKYIDNQNLNNAYISNMQQDLRMQGNDLINTQVIFNVGNTVFLLPWMFLLPRIPINYALFFTEMCWAVFTIGLSKVTNVPQLKALRFFVGAFEAAYFPCIHYLLASWYKSHEIGRRGALFYMGQFLGVLTSGLIASATSDNLNGSSGLEGWRWLFLIDGIMTIVVAIMALVFIPGTPSRCYSLFLSDEEILLARKRMKENGSDISRTTKAFFDKTSWKKVFCSWQVYLLSILQTLGFNTNNSSSGSFLLWLKSLNKYSSGEINKLSTVPPALGIFYIIIVCVGADLTRKRFAFIIFSYIMNFIGNIILTIWDVSYVTKWFAFCSAYWAWSQSSVFNPLISDLLRKDNNARAIGWMIMYILGVQSTAWISKLVWPTEDSPRYLKGFSTCAGFSIGFILLFCLAYFLYKRDERKEALENGIYLYNSSLEIPDIVKNDIKSEVEALDSEDCFKG